MKIDPKVLEGRVTAADSRAYWYGWGRLDAGEPPVHGMSSNTDAVWKFGRLYGEQERAYALEQRGFAHGIQTSWENFRASGGKTIYREGTDDAMRKIKVAHDGMEDRDYVEGWTDGETWNGFVVPWLDYAAIYAMDKASPLFEREESHLDMVPDPEAEGEFLLFEVVNGERHPLKHMQIRYRRHWCFDGWTFSEVEW